MSEFESGQQHVPERKTGVESHYAQVMGFELPDSPEAMRAEIVLPPEATGDFIEAILAQGYEYQDPRERSQLVGLIGRDGKPYNSPVFIGTTDSVRDTHREIQRWFLPLIGQENTVLTYWHTHPARYTSNLSRPDAAQRVGMRHKDLIYLLGAPDGITAVMQTKQGIRKQTQTSVIGDIAKEDGLLKSRKYDGSSATVDLSYLARYFEERGYVLYKWRKESDDDTIIRANERGVFTDGIPLTRIGDPVWLRKIRDKRDD